MPDPPADFPGHQSYCPYTAGTKDGVWHGPDMAKARRLGQSRTTNVPVTVWTIKDFAGRAVGSYLVRMLKDLGYRANLRTVSGAQFYAAVATPTKIQVGLTGWGPDFPAPSNSSSRPELPLVLTRSRHTQPRRVLRSSRRPAGQPGAGCAADRPSRRSKTVGTGGPHRHRPGTMGPDPQLETPDSSPPGSGTTRSPRFTARCSTRCGSGKTGLPFGQTCDLRDAEETRVTPVTRSALPHDVAGQQGLALRQGFRSGAARCLRARARSSSCPTSGSRRPRSQSHVPREVVDGWRPGPRSPPPRRRPGRWRARTRTTGSPCVVVGQQLQARNSLHSRLQAEPEGEAVLSAEVTTPARDGPRRQRRASWCS